MPKHAVRNWALLFALTGLCSHAMQLVRFPASALLGGMLAAILLAVNTDGMHLSPPLFAFGQGVIGLMIGLRMPQGFFSELRHSWPLFVGGVIFAIAASSLLGWLLTTWKIFPGTTAVWGLSPGAASSMVVMSEAYGGDIRLVAFMQYFRNVSVVLATSIVARLWGADNAPTQAQAWLIMPGPQPFLLALGVILIALFLAKRLRVPAGSLLLPMFAGMYFNYSGLAAPDIPPWLLSFGSMLVGWSIGLRFTRSVLGQIAHALPAVAFAVFVLLGLCALFSVILYRCAGVDPLTAYLAACPGGLDSVAIISASANADTSFVLAMHTARFLMVVLLGPFLAQWIVKQVDRQVKRKTNG